VPDKLEVLQGPGLVARFGEVAVWAGPQATAALQAHLVSEAQRMSQGPSGGDQLANSLIAILQRGDPEPQAPFAVVGPGANGLTLFLHGPVQAWDSGRWLAPQPVPGWVVTSIARPWPLIILPYGASPPPQSQQGNPFDLLSGTVPGAGFVLLRPPTGPGQPAGLSQTTGATQTAPAGYGPGSPTVGTSGPGLGSPVTGGPGSAGTGPVGGPPGPFGAQPGPYGAQPGPSGGGPSGGGPSGGGPSGGGPSGGGQPAGDAPYGAAQPGGHAPYGAGQAGYGSSPTDSQSSPAVGSASPAGQAAGAAIVASPSPVSAPASQLAPPIAQVSSGGPIDLRNAGGPSLSPLPLASTWATSLASDRPYVEGVRCEQGHFNHPRTSNCLRCGRPLPAGSQQISGPRPSIGALLADDGSIWALTAGCLIGAAPASANDTQSGAMQAIAMRAGANHTMAPVQAEVQIIRWSAFLVDRGAEGGTWWQGPAAPGWSQLSRNEQRELAAGSHLSCGGRVLTYLSAWPE
jgi:hypothetical protein